MPSYTYLGTSEQDMVSVSVNLPKDMLTDVDGTVEESAIFETRSQYVRAAVRHFQMSGERTEFTEAR